MTSDTPLIDHLVMREFVTESPVLGKVREQFVDLEQSSLRNDNFLGARSHLSSEKAFSTICWCVVTITMLELGATARSI